MKVKEKAYMEVWARNEGELKIRLENVGIKQTEEAKKGARGILCSPPSLVSETQSREWN